MGPYFYQLSARRATSITTPAARTPSSRRSSRSARAAERRSDAVGQLGVASQLRAVRTAEEVILGLDPVADHRASAVLTARRHLVDRALERIERVGLPGR